MIPVVVINQDNIGSLLNPILEIERASFPTPWSSNAFIQEARNPISHLWGLRDGDSLGGYICFWMFVSEIQLLNIAVHPKQRRKGLGELLLREMIRTGLASGVEQVWLEVRTSNLTAQRLYERLMFVEAGRRRRYYQDTNEDAIVMSLSLAEAQPAARH